MHIDLRLLNKVEFHPPHVVRMGAGNTWKNVLDVVDPNKYTLIHGNVSFSMLNFRLSFQQF